MDVDDISDSCRLCASKSLTFNIFKSEVTTSDLKHKIYAATGVAIERTDKYSQHICLNCNYWVNRCFRFRTESLKNSRIFNAKVTQLELSNVIFNSIRDEEISLQTVGKTQLENVPNIDNHDVSERLQGDGDKEVIEYVSFYNSTNASTKRGRKTIKELYPSLKLPDGLIVRDLECCVLIERVEHMLKESFKQSSYHLNDDFRSVSASCTNKTPSTGLSNSPNIERNMDNERISMIDQTVTLKAIPHLEEQVNISTGTTIRQDSVSVKTHQQPPDPPILTNYNSSQALKCHLCQRCIDDKEILQRHIFYCHRSPTELTLSIQPLKIARDYRGVNLNKILYKENEQALLLQYDTAHQHYALPIFSTKNRLYSSIDQQPIVLDPLPPMTPVVPVPVPVPVPVSLPKSVSVSTQNITITEPIYVLSESQPNVEGVRKRGSLSTNEEASPKRNRVDRSDFQNYMQNEHEVNEAVQNLINIEFDGASYINSNTMIVTNDGARTKTCIVKQSSENRNKMAMANPGNCHSDTAAKLRINPISNNVSKTIGTVTVAKEYVASPSTLCRQIQEVSTIWSGICSQVTVKAHSVSKSVMEAVSEYLKNVTADSSLCTNFINLGKLVENRDLRVVYSFGHEYLGSKLIYSEEIASNDFGPHLPPIIWNEVKILEALVSSQVSGATETNMLTEEDALLSLVPPVNWKTSLARPLNAEWSIGTSNSSLTTVPTRSFLIVNKKTSLLKPVGVDVSKTTKTITTSSRNSCCSDNSNSEKSSNSNNGSYSGYQIVQYRRPIRDKIASNKQDGPTFTLSDSSESDTELVDLTDISQLPVEKSIELAQSLASSNCNVVEMLKQNDDVAVKIQSRAEAEIDDTCDKLSIVLDDDADLHTGINKPVDVIQKLKILSPSKINSLFRVT